jgi:hypothetical protein
MTFLMTLISKHKTDKGYIIFYDGIDFDFVRNFPSDGSNGICIFLINSWILEVKKWQRTQKLNKILEDKDLNLDPRIENNYVAIYQTNGELEKIYNILLEKFNI